MSEQEPYLDEAQPMPFEFLGYFVEYYDLEFNRNLGIQVVRECPDGMLLGAIGAKEETLTVPIVLSKGHKTVTIKASKKRPLRVRKMVQLLCGRSLESLSDFELTKANSKTQ